MSYVRDPKKVFEKHPDKDIIDENWANLPDDAYAEFMVEFDHEYGELMNRYAALGKMDIQVNMGATTGVIWKYYGFPKKRFCYRHTAWPLWLSWFEKHGCWFNWVEPYCVALKGENTDVASIEKHKSRIFYMAGPMTDNLGKTLCQNFNKALQETSWCRIGTMWQYGGIIEMRKEMERFLQNNPEFMVLMKDCSKFDITRQLRNFMLDAAVRCLYPVHGIKWFREILLWLFRQALYKYLILPYSNPRKWFHDYSTPERQAEYFMTCVLIIEWLQASGNFETSEGNSFDNFFDHWVVMCYFGSFNMEQMVRRCYFNIYSDDDLIIVPKEYADYKQWLIGLAKCGRVLKPFEAEPDHSIVGKVFCGVSFTEKGFTVARDKCYYSANVVGTLTPMEYREKLYSLAANLAGDEKEFQTFVDYVTPEAEKITGPLNFNRSRLVGTGYVFLPQL